MRLADLAPALSITRREVRDQFRDWRIIFPVFGLTVFFPFLMNFTANQILDFVREYGANIIGERLVPFLLMIVGFFPISVSLVIALESFVGEKERASIEPLLTTPLKDWQLYLGKLLSSTVPPLISSYLGMAVYLTGLYLNKIPWPEPLMLLQIVVLTTVQAVVMVSGAVVVSSQATSVRAANLLASFIIIPVAFLVQGEALLMFWGNYQTLWWAVIGLIVLGILMIRVGLAHFRREELLGKEIDVLNIKWGLKMFFRSFVGQSKNIADWYTKCVFPAIWELRSAILIILLIAITGIVVGAYQVDRFPIPVNPENLSQLNTRIEGMLRIWPLFSFQPVFAIWWQNTRVLLIALVLGVFSFGVLGVMPLFATMGVAGYLLALLQGTGLNVYGLITSLILPHGIIEIPAAIIASAAVLQQGAILATPTPDRTVGEVWITSLAVWAKIMVGVVIPALFIAAMIEIWVTPRIAINLLINVGSGLVGF
jgi:uncharacterized membrane protein SpoIIM required for sporulation